MKEITFLPGHQSERRNCYDRVEKLTPYQGNPIFGPEYPWEGDCTAYPCVLYIPKEKIYKMWYMTVAKESASALDGTLIDNHEMRCERSYVCYAVSKDGISWERPALDILRKDVYPGNNIVYQDSGFFCGCPTVIYEENEEAGRRYKLMIYDNDGKGTNGVRTMISSDGIHWSQAGRFPALPSQDTPSLWKDQKSGFYYAFLKERLNGQRCRLYSHSADFEHWSEPAPSLVPESTDPSTLNYYAQCVFSDQGSNFSLVSLFDLAEQVTQLELAEMDGGRTLRLPTRPVVLRVGRGDDWDSNGVYGGNSEPIYRDGLRWVYYGGSDDRHDVFSNKISIGMASFVPGRLAGQQFEGEGYFITLPLLCPGGKLFLNAETGGANELRVEIQDIGYGGALESFREEDCLPVSGDSALLPVTWKEADSLDSLAGRYIRLKISGSNSRIYGASFHP